MVFILANSAAARTQRQAGANGNMPHSTQFAAFRVPHLKRVGLKRPSLYRILSKQGNPTLATFQEILKPLGLRASVALAEAA